MGKKRGNPLPLLPPEVEEDEIEVSDEDLQFVKENRYYAGFLSKLDTKSITKHVVRLADGKKEDALESFYEKRKKKAFIENNEGNALQLDPVDALPVKTLDGKLYYRTSSVDVTKPQTGLQEDNTKTNDQNVDNDENKIKPTKAERREKLKKIKKIAKKQVEEENKIDEVQRDLKSEVLEKVKQELSAEELFLQKKGKIAEIGMGLLADPENNIASLKELVQTCNDTDHNVAKLGLLSLLALFKDIIPGYRIRLPTDKELQMKVSKEVKKMRDYESMLLNSYKAYLQKLVAFGKQPFFQQVAVRCICNLLEAVPHFNYRENLLAETVKNTSSSDDVIRKLSCSAIKSLFMNEGKHGGEATVEAVQLIADHVKIHNCQLHPDCIEVFLALSFDEDLAKSTSENGKEKVKPKKKGKHTPAVPNQLAKDDKKLSKKELAAKTRVEVNTDFKAVSFAPDASERKKLQTQTLAAVFETYFRILKQSIESTAGIKIGSGTKLRPLLIPCLKGLGKFSHLISVDFMGDLLNKLKRLASGRNLSTENCRTVSERIQCCIVAFKVMRNNLDSLIIDLQEFFIHLYNLLLECKPNREDEGELLAEALKTMLCEGRQHDMQRAAAFIKRLATFSLCYGPAEAMAALVTMKHLLQKNSKCRNLLENDGGGGSLSCSVAKYHPDATDPNLSGALSSVLWELSLLSKHYHPAVSAMASSIANMGTGHNQMFLSIISPGQAFSEYSIARESFKLSIKPPASICKRKKVMDSQQRKKVLESSADPHWNDQEHEDLVRKRFSDHFKVFRNILENERLRRELNLTMSSIHLYEEYRREKKKKKRRCLDKV
ncbi:nucleolar complex protein 3 homolog [Amborella trichopoda]|uniref:Nucleolar complex protein 3 homolog n=1 Tax=Amborella trichopoda TaxID=13333 RepID=U5CNR4_AMBTC|nr:nucleolar complex protein 3 homolog [Amborella trichopoda]XP_020528462.1 nucleolar complex protein 3 homolog [Amborella trichopoda]ERN14796.1 hypothetical protein AMTR_s00032p00071070 [Amborella trichopoda]|eukprot:XP_006853329.1 nucleolar complex protein 3 homolog [Amborella trichopoda]